VHRDFDADRRAADPERDPVTFALGGETFTVVSDPSLGDTFALADAPEFDPQDLNSTTSIGALRALKRFIRTMIEPDEHERFELALSRVPTTQGYVLMEVAAWIAEQVTGFPTQPPASSSGGRPTSRSGGGTSKHKPGGRSSSPKSRRAGRSR
jgi:hypothetical protein